MNPLPYRPLYCVWELTLACNLRCGHCGSSAGKPRDSELSTDEALDAVSQLADLECRLITLSGGEPTLRPDWEAIARAAIARGVVVNMVTNGTTMTESLAARIADSGLANVAVSLDGPEALHDENRGAGTFRRSARALELLGTRKVPTAVLTHLDVRSAARLEEIHDLAVDLGAAAFRVQLGKPMGELALRRERVIQPRDLLDLLPRIARLKKRSSIRVDVGDSIGYYGPHERTLRTKGWGGMRNLWTGCQAGRFAIGIESGGGIKGCLSLQGGLNGVEDRDPFREGSLRERRLADLWFDPTAFAFNRCEGTDHLTGECARCGHAAICRGGAKCVSSAFTGALSEDPYCFTRVAQLEGRARSLPRRQTAAAAAVVGLGLITNVSCSADYGIEPPPECRAACDAGVAPDAADPCANACPEYGVMPLPDAGVAPDAGDPCADVCCDCDYGIPPPPECCDD